MELKDFLFFPSCALSLLSVPNQTLTLSGSIPFAPFSQVFVYIDEIPLKAAELTECVGVLHTFQLHSKQLNPLTGV